MYIQHSNKISYNAKGYKASFVRTDKNVDGKNFTHTNRFIRIVTFNPGLTSQVASSECHDMLVAKHSVVNIAFRLIKGVFPLTKAKGCPKLNVDTPDAIPHGIDLIHLSRRRPDNESVAIGKTLHISKKGHQQTGIGDI